MSEGERFECLTPGCGREPLLRQHEDFVLEPDALAASRALPLYERGRGLLRSRHGSQYGHRMSEYQYYEFRAVDRPLSRTTRPNCARFRRAPGSPLPVFVNHYNWGDFGGNPDRLMDAISTFSCISPTGARGRLSIRLPKSGLKPADLKRFTAVNEDVVVRTAGDHLIVDVSCYELEQDFCDRGEGWLDKLAAFARDLINGRPAAVLSVWLMPVDTGKCPDDAIEPLAGIGPLTPAL